MPDNLTYFSGGGGGSLIDDFADSETLQAQIAALQQRLSSQQAGPSTLHTPAPSNESRAQSLASGKTASKCRTKWKGLKMNYLQVRSIVESFGW